MRKRIREILAGIKIVAVLSLMWWSVSHASYGLLGKWFGQEFLDWVSTKMSVFNVAFPYILFGACSLWLVYKAVEWVQRRTHKPRSGADDVDKEQIVSQIRGELNQSSSRVSELLDKLK